MRLTQLHASAKPLRGVDENCVGGADNDEEAQSAQSHASRENQNMGSFSQLGHLGNLDDDEVRDAPQLTPFNLLDGLDDSIVKGVIWMEIQKKMLRYGSVSLCCPLESKMFFLVSERNIISSRNSFFSLPKCKVGFVR